MHGWSESTTIEIVSSRGAYPVHVGSGVVDRTIEDQKFGVMIVDRRFVPAFEHHDLPIVPVDARESEKTMSTCESIMVSMKELGLKRSERVIAVGGGVVQDLATFSSALYMRGVEWVYAPTTMMAMADSCIGGKSSINAGGVKNLVGNIYPPTAVLIDSGYTGTLGSVDLACGLAEALKITFCRGKSAFEGMQVAIRGWNEGADLTPAIVEALKAKKWFIEVDEFDREERQLLNFGHTFGHAIESASGYAVPHGIAVALGMRAAVAFSGLSHIPLVSELDSICRELSMEAVRAFRDSGRIISRVDFFKAFESDKKHGPRTFVLVLPAREGGVERISIPDSPDIRDEIWMAVDTVLVGAGHDA